MPDRIGRSVITMDYYALISRAVSDLPNNTDEARQELYDRARRAQAKQLAGDTRTEAAHERQALEEAIRKVENSPLQMLTDFRDPTKLTRVLQIALGAYLVVSIASILSDIGQYLLLQSTFSPADGAANDDRQALVSRVYIAIFAVTVIIFSR